MAVRRRKQAQAARADGLRYDQQNSLSTVAFEAADDGVLSGAGSLVAKGADLVSDGGNALGGLARAGMRAAGSLPFDSVADAARGTASAAGGLGSSSAEAALNATGAVLSNAGDLVGPALDAAGDVAGSVLGAAADAAGDILSA